jgi:stage II sporulation protein D
MFSIFMRFTLIFAFAFWPFDRGDEEAEIEKTRLDLPKNAEEVQLVRILLVKNVPEIVIETTSSYRVLDSGLHPLFKGDRIVATPVRANASGIQIGSQTFKNTPLTIQSDGGGIKVGKHIYRSALKIWRESSQAISVVNEIDVEDYLKGVLPWEANPEWPMEALKAQAVASRTYALFRTLEKQDEKFALHQDVKSQVYKGKAIENPKTNQAIEDTRGKILTYKGKIFPAFFHSTCGGQTTRADYLWKVQKNPVFRGVSCNFCWQSKHYRWQAKFTRKEIETVLRKHGFQVSGIKNIVAADLDASGRARKFVIEHRGGKTKIHSNDFRLWMDPARFKSTLIQGIAQDGGAYIFRGRGWGHGVGMCQYGMKGLAELGYSYPQILDYYYPGAEITNARET